MHILLIVWRTFALNLWSISLSLSLSLSLFHVPLSLISFSLSLSLSNFNFDAYFAYFMMHIGLRSITYLSLSLPSLSLSLTFSLSLSIFYLDTLMHNLLILWCTFDLDPLLISLSLSPSLSLERNVWWPKKAGHGSQVNPGEWTDESS